MAAEWSNYLKRAVATVERRLDEALEMPPNSNSAEKTTTTHIESESSVGTDAVEHRVEDEDQPDLETGPTLEFPDLTQAVSAVRKLAVDISESCDENIKDTSLNTVDVVEAAGREYDAFINDLNAKLSTLLTKIKYLSHSKVEKLSTSKEAAAKRELQIASLIEEGQRLAQQELKLNMVIKKLRSAEKSVPQPVAKPVKEVSNAELEKALSDLEIERTRAASQQQSFKKELANEKSNTDALRKQLADQAALIEHYRSLAEATPQDQQAGDLQRRLDTVQAHHAAATDNWNNIEAGLLSRIAELEAKADDDQKQRASTLQKLQATQKSLSEARDAANASALAAETANTECKRAVRQVQDLKEQIKKLESTIEARSAEIDAARQETEKASANLSQARIEWEQREADLVAAATPTPSVGPNDSFFESEVSLPSIHPLEAGTPTPRSPIESRRDSLASDFDHSMFMSNASSINVRSESTHMLGKLNMAVRRLETELSSTKQALELANAEKTEAYNELLGAINASEDLENARKESASQKTKIAELEGKVDSLLVKLGEKSERVQELEADVQDLKEAYREQIEALLR